MVSLQILALAVVAMASVSSASLSLSGIRRRQAADLLPPSPYGYGAADGYGVGPLANGAADPSRAAANGPPSPYGAGAAASDPADPAASEYGGVDGYSRGGPAEAGGYNAAGEYDGSTSKAGAGAGAECVAETPRFPAYAATARPSVPSSFSYELRPSSYTTESEKPTASYTMSNSRTANPAFPTTAGYEATAYQAYPESTAVPAGGAAPHDIAGYSGYLASNCTGYDGYPAYNTTGYDYTGYNYTSYPTYNYAGYPTYNYTGYPMYSYTGSPVAYDNFTGYPMYNYPGYPSPGNPASTRTVTDIVTVETTVTIVPATARIVSTANNRTVAFTAFTTSTSVSVLKVTTTVTTHFKTKPKSKKKTKSKSKSRPETPTPPPSAAAADTAAQYAEAADPYGAAGYAADGVYPNPAAAPPGPAFSDYVINDSDAPAD